MLQKPSSDATNSTSCRQGARTFGVSDADQYWQRRQAHNDVGQRRLHRFLARTICRLTDPGAAVLDCGVGSGHVFRLCCHDRRMYGVEISAHAIAACDFPTETIRQADLNQGIPDFGVQFQAILASMVLHWLDDPAGFLAAAQGRLAAGGRLIVVIPNITYYRHRIAYLFGRFPPVSLSHRNFQTPSEFEQMARQTGWRIVRRASPKRTPRAWLWPTVFSQDIVYILREAAT
jgi:2-polyprenyl-3-methyl-5-hydroxy-6-metoxy-1,4-benzoquinol methylase